MQTVQKQQQSLQRRLTNERKYFYISNNCRDPTRMWNMKLYKTVRPLKRS